MGKPNILLIVLDSARTDYFKQHATNLMRESKDGVFYEQAVAPARWSLPSHASIFSGKLPSEHQVYFHNDDLPAPLVDELSSEGYFTSGFSANPYASKRCNFDQQFDLFDEPGRYAESEFRPAEHDSKYSGPRHYMSVVNKALLHNSPIGSLKNVAVDGGSKFGIINGDRRTYNTFKEASNFLQNYDDDSPYFTFVNLMSTHSPYQPSIMRQLIDTNSTLRQGEIRTLNRSLIRPPEFLDGYYSNSRSISEENLEKIRNLYLSEMKNADIYASELYQQAGKVDNDRETLVIITADHGQALGEPEYNGDRRMGHVETVSDNVLKVPLLVIHPEISDAPDQTAVLRSLFYLCKNAAADGEVSLTDMAPKNKVAISECPATGNQEYLSRDNIPGQVNDLQAKIHTVVGYHNNVKYMERSNGECKCWKDGIEMPVSDVPPILIEDVHDSLERLANSEKDTKTREVNNEAKKRLNYLGYM